MTQGDYWQRIEIADWLTDVLAETGLSTDGLVARIEAAATGAPITECDVARWLVAEPPEPTLAQLCRIALAADYDMSRIEMVCALGSSPSPEAARLAKALYAALRLAGGGVYLEYDEGTGTAGLDSRYPLFAVVALLQLMAGDLLAPAMRPEPGTR